MTKALVVDGLHRPRAGGEAPGARWVAMVLVTARVPAGAAVTLTVIATQPDGAGRVARLLAADPAGQVHAELPIPPGGRGYRVQAAWSDRNQQWTPATPATEVIPP